MAKQTPSSRPTRAGSLRLPERRRGSAPVCPIPPPATASP